MPNCMLHFLEFKVTHFLSEGVRIELQLLPISEMAKFHTLTLTVYDWPFGITINRHFRLKPGYSYMRAYCKQIDRALKELFKERLPKLLRPTIPELWKFLKNLFCCFLEKKTIDTKSFKFRRYKIQEIFFITKQKFPLSKKYQKLQFWVQWL